MNKVKWAISLIVILLIIISLCIMEILELHNRFDQVKIFDYQDDSLKMINAMTLQDTIVLLTTNYIDNLFRYKSPFNDGRSFDELIGEFVHDFRQDYYGSPRRSENCPRIHEGLDFFVPENTPVFPLSDFGIVTETSGDDNFSIKIPCLKYDNSPDSVDVKYGKVVRILYPEGIESLYAHLTEIYVKPGDIVSSSDPVGLTGMTGNAKESGKASHLHLELRDSTGQSFDPLWRLHYNFIDVKTFISKLD
ncbi:MAG: M23 family metallopeptidase [Candidatus Cloacimonetes bacterium]|nr:M23 family metallopeptidase [Candidatus Cloacimonadota bacterium]